MEDSPRDIRLTIDEIGAGTLSLRPNGENDFQVQLCGITVGQIIARRRSFGRAVWFWSLFATHMPETMGGAGSHASTLAGAKAAIKTTLDIGVNLMTGERGNIPWAKAETDSY